MKAIRKQRGMTQSAVARQAGIAQSTYASIENGSRRPSVKVAKRLGAILRINWTWFFEEARAADKEAAERE